MPRRRRPRRAHCQGLHRPVVLSKSPTTSLPMHSPRPVPSASPGRFLSSVTRTWCCGRSSRPRRSSRGASRWRGYPPPSPASTCCRSCPSRASHPSMPASPCGSTPTPPPKCQAWRPASRSRPAPMCWASRAATPLRARRRLRGSTGSPSSGSSRCRLTATSSPTTTRRARRRCATPSRSSGTPTGRWTPTAGRSRRTRPRPAGSWTSEASWVTTWPSG